MPLLTIDHLYVSFLTSKGLYPAVEDISLRLNTCETLAIVGESGSGKSTVAHAILKLLPENNSMVNGNIFFQEKDVYQLNSSQIRELRGNDISIIFQDPLTALNPTMKIGNQILEAIFAHNRIDKKNAKNRVLEVLSEVGFSNPEEIYHSFPFQLSGGMRQRAVIAQAIVNRPKLLIADEPTTALDAELRVRVLELLKSLQVSLKMGLLLISHDLKLVARVSDRVAVMKEGRILETNSALDIFQKPQHDYTKQLLHACVYKRGAVCLK